MEGGEGSTVVGVPKRKIVASLAKRSSTGSEAAKEGNVDAVEVSGGRPARAGPARLGTRVSAGRGVSVLETPSNAERKDNVSRHHLTDRSSCFSLPDSADLSLADSSPVPRRGPLSCALTFADPSSVPWAAAAGGVHLARDSDANSTSTGRKGQSAGRSHSRW